MRVQGIDDAVLRFVRFTADEERRLARAIVEEGVADAGAGGKRGEVAGFHRVESAVDPGVDLALEDVDEFLFARLGMGPGDAVAGGNALDVEADLEEARGAADGAGRGHRLGGVWVTMRGFGE